jgi:hypothetical protein
MSRYKDISNQTFGKLTTLSVSGRASNGSVRWVCLCQCGETCVVKASSLVCGKTKSCGCARYELVSRHGMSNSSEHHIWSSMIQRCCNPKNQAYRNYGARGIKVCQRWMTFENFFSDMGNRPERLTLERTNNNGNYEPSNCRWATRIEQCTNRRGNVLLTIDGTTKTVSEWAKISHRSPGTISRRLKSGWPHKRAVFEPSRMKQKFGNVFC